MKIKWSIIYSTFLGSGFFPLFPGTIGSLVAMVIYLLLPGVIFEQLSNQLIFSGILVIFSLISVPVVTRAEKYLGHDCGKIVVDEVAGYFVAVLFLPKSLLTALLGFVFFRIFDIFKPEPVNMLQKLPGGWGVMVDDLMAGIYANIIVRILLKIIL